MSRKSDELNDQGTRREGTKGRKEAEEAEEVEEEKGKGQESGAPPLCTRL